MYFFVGKLRIRNRFLAVADSPLPLSFKISYKNNVLDRMCSFCIYGLSNSYIIFIT